MVDLAASAGARKNGKVFTLRYEKTDIKTASAYTLSAGPEGLCEVRKETRLYNLV